MNYAEALARLDPEQRHVANWTPAEGNLRVQATAGSGKTTALVGLASTLIHRNLWPAAQLVVTTFSRKAADEIAERIGRLVDPTGIKMSTWHGLGLRLLRARDPAAWNIGRCTELPIGRRAVDVPSSIQIWRDVTGWRSIQSLGRKGLNLDTGLGAILDQHRFDMAKGRRIEEGPSDTDPPYYFVAWKLFEEIKQKRGLWDWNDVLLAWVDLLRQGERKHPLVVLVDEAQDNSKVQLEIAQRLASHPDGRLVLVGDSRQAIHTWRGAHPELFIEAESRLGATTRYLHRTYRCPQRVTAFANALVSGVSWADGPPASAHKALEGITTFRQICVEDEVIQRVQGGESPDRLAVLARTNADVGKLALQLLARGINARVLGGGNILKSRVAQDMLAWVGAVEAPTEAGWMRVYRTPSRYLRKTWAASVWDKARNGGDLLDAIERTPTRTSGVATLCRDLRNLRKQGTLGARLDYVAREILGLRANDEKLAASSPDRRQSEERARDDRVAGALVELATAFSVLDDFLALQTLTDDKTAPAVTLSTMHRAKGLEWPIVYVLAEHGKVPHAKGDPDEELRLFYVAVTRAEEELHCVFAEKPSSYIEPYLVPMVHRQKPHNTPSTSRNHRSRS